MPTQNHTNKQIPGKKKKKTADQQNRDIKHAHVCLLAHTVVPLGRVGMSHGTVFYGDPLIKPYPRLLLFTFD